MVLCFRLSPVSRYSMGACRLAQSLGEHHAHMCMAQNLGALSNVCPVVVKMSIREAALLVPRQPGSQLVSTHSMCSPGSTRLLMRWQTSKALHGSFFYFLTMGSQQSVSVCIPRDTRKNMCRDLW